MRYVYLLQKIDNGYVHAVFATRQAAERYRLTQVAQSDYTLWAIIEREVQ